MIFRKGIFKLLIWYTHLYTKKNLFYLLFFVNFSFRLIKWFHKGLQGEPAVYKKLQRKFGAAVFVFIPLV